MSGMSLETCAWNLKYVLEQAYAFNAQKNLGSRDPGHSLFSKNSYRIISGLSLETVRHILYVCVCASLTMFLKHVRQIWSV